MSVFLSNLTKHRQLSCIMRHDEEMQNKVIGSSSSTKLNKERARKNMENRRDWMMENYQKANFTFIQITTCKRDSWNQQPFFLFLRSQGTKGNSISVVFQKAYIEIRME